MRIRTVILCIKCVKERCYYYITLFLLKRVCLCFRTALARFRQAQLEEGKVKERRPYLASECDELPKAEKWRRQVSGLGEFRIRDLNDEINKLLREKRHWEVRIKELGGPDYRRFGPRMLDHEGREVPGNRGYKYFGAARDLPGVRELFEKEPAPEVRKTRAELMKDVDAEYYGYRDEDDGVLLPLEAQHEKNVIQEAVEKWRSEKDQNRTEEEEDIYKVTDHQFCISRISFCSDSQYFVVNIVLYFQVEEALIRRKKMELLQRYASETLQHQSREARTLLGL
uniref:Uncharacterized protein n=1 Tax=Periophthalmus magnuspinnatus TaxID=409849 RepID=A0A3B4ATX0_9GOBI